MAGRVYFVYVMASQSGTLYTGVTNDLERRVAEHKQGLTPGFTRKYGVSRLLYYEEFGDIYEAIAREKEIKRWRREKKIALFEETNPHWLDISSDWD